jgi:hypothetical protein
MFFMFFNLRQHRPAADLRQSLMGYSAYDGLVLGRAGSPPLRDADRRQARQKVN